MFYLGHFIAYVIVCDIMLYGMVSIINEQAVTHNKSSNYTVYFIAWYDSCSNKHLLQYEVIAQLEHLDTFHLSPL